MLSRSYSFAISGLEAIPIEIEVDSSAGLPGLSVVGLPDQAVKESRERVRSALINSGYQLPQRRITVNLAPADLKKEGGHFDLAISLGLLAASEQLDPAKIEEFVAVGELALDGSLRPVPGILPIAMALKDDRRKSLLVPFANASEASVVKGVRVISIANLKEAVEVISDTRHPKCIPNSLSELTESVNRYEVDFADVKGQALAKRALEVAVAGAHHVLLIGPPGSGKSMLAKRIPTIQPDLSLDEVLETTKIHSIMGLLKPDHPLITQRPFRSPHHTSSAISLIGGGPNPRPGEISLAQYGVLFLDELPEFRRDVLESLRQPLEDGKVNVSRAKRTCIFPARFMLVSAMNPCPCGYLTDANHPCRCSQNKIAQYLSKISGPLLDRLDLHIEVPAVPFHVLSQEKEEEPSSTIKQRVIRAREIQRKRLKNLGIFANAQMGHREIKKACPLTIESKEFLKNAMQELALSARAYDKIVKISRTISDLDESEDILPKHLAEAIQYRSLDRHLWM